MQLITSLVFSQTELKVKIMDMGHQIKPIAQIDSLP